MVLQCIACQILIEIGQLLPGVVGQVVFQTVHDQNVVIGDQEIVVVGVVAFRHRVSVRVQVVVPGQIRIGARIVERRGSCRLGA